VVIRHLTKAGLLDKLSFEMRAIVVGVFLGLRGVLCLISLGLSNNGGMM
jgi:hypothetical protein